MGLEAFMECCAELDELVTDMYELRKNVHTKEEVHGEIMLASFVTYFTYKH